MYKKLILETLLVVVIVCSILYTVTALRTSHSETDSQPALPQDVGTEVNSVQQQPEMKFTELFRSQSKVFYCGYSDNEHNCRLTVSDSDGNNKTDLGIPLSHGIKDGYEPFLPSADGRYVLIAREYAAILMDSSSLVQKVLYEAQPGTALGLFSGALTFIPHVKWVGDKEVQVSVYKDGTTIPQTDTTAPEPLLIKTVPIE